MLQVVLCLRARPRSLTPRTASAGRQLHCDRLRRAHLHAGRAVPALAVVADRRPCRSALMNIRSPGQSRTHIGSSAVPQRLHTFSSTKMPIARSSSSRAIASRRPTDHGAVGQRRQHDVDVGALDRTLDHRDACRPRRARCSRTPSSARRRARGSRGAPGSSASASRGGAACARPASARPSTRSITLVALHQLVAALGA